MGQRTQIVLAIDDRANNKKIVKVWHRQFGNGRQMYLDLMNIANQFYHVGHSFDNAAERIGLTAEADGCSLVKYMDLHFAADIFNEILTPAGADDIIFSGQDNNNGGLVIHIVIEPWSKHHQSKIEYGFLLGYEDEYHISRYDDGTIWNPENAKYGKAFSRWLSAEEYAGLEINKDYANKEFLDMFLAFTKYFDIEYIGAGADVLSEVTETLELCL